MAIIRHLPHQVFLIRLLGLLCLLTVSIHAVADTPKPTLSIEDLFLLEGPRGADLAPDQQKLAYIRRWIDSDSLEERFSLWLVESNLENARPLEEDEPDARTALFSPDGKWIAVRSTRPRPEGWDPLLEVPPESDAATDIWLIPASGGSAIPLAGPERPYGRVFQDSFYGRLAFSPDGSQLAFVADDGQDPRTSEEIESGVIVVRTDQGEGYTGYQNAQIWIAEIDPDPAEQGARSIRRLTDDSIWYGDPQWTPDGQFLICHANKSDDVESVRFSINKNYDLWEIEVHSGQQRQLTTGPGPEVSPRVSPDGSQIVCLSSPRKGPHADVFNLMVIDRAASGGVASTRVLHNHHLPNFDEPNQQDPPHPIPAFPLPDDCWDGSHTLRYSSPQGTETLTIELDLQTGTGVPLSSATGGEKESPLQQRLDAKRRLTPPGNTILRERTLAEERLFTWTHEGLELEGVITIPPADVAEAPYPLVVYPHGGPHSRSTRGFNFTVEILAANGYLVFQPNFRGSAGYGRLFLDADRYDLGGGDMDDILVGIRELADQQLIQQQRQFVYGISYGGFMTTWLVGHTDQFSAAVAQNAVTDMHMMWGLSDLQSWTEWELGGRPWEVPLAMQRHSPLAYADRVRTPTLILHSREDRRCPLPMGRMFHRTLQALDVPTEMVIYPNEGHGIRQPRHQTDVLRRVLAWFAEHDPGPQP